MLVEPRAALPGSLLAVLLSDTKPTPVSGVPGAVQASDVAWQESAARERPLPVRTVPQATRSTGTHRRAT
jgi:hypothetical protein